MDISCGYVATPSYAPMGKCCCISSQRGDANASTVIKKELLHPGEGLLLTCVSLVPFPVYPQHLGAFRWEPSGSLLLQGDYVCVAQRAWHIGPPAVFAPSDEGYPDVFQLLLMSEGPIPELCGLGAPPPVSLAIGCAFCRLPVWGLLYVWVGTTPLSVLALTKVSVKPTPELVPQKKNSFGHNSPLVP